MSLIIVSGVSRGLGLALATDLLDTGYHVAGCSQTMSPELEVLRGKTGFHWAETDIGDAGAIESFVQGAVDAFPDQKLWGVVNNAGAAVEGILSTLPVVEIERVLQVNLTGAICLARAALRRMLRQGGAGRIINIGSITGLRGYTGLSAYAASKAGLDGFSRALAREVGRRGITVNSVAPGYMQTALSATLADRQLDQIVRRTPLNRLCELSDVVPVIRFLLSEEARFVTGQTIVVDGGLTS
ncbi:MAG TPA: SDR family oxidoreductase [Stellaceae bacterium]|jgi:3-oxoacyl-[acyl-carrier protein] reductase|nr:SDR family oxidoreductase [Stellaceae bacterium]